MAKIKKTMGEHSEDALYREVWEDVKVQQIFDFLRRHIKPIIISVALAAMIVAGVGLFLQIKRSNQMDVARSYESAMDKDMPATLSREALSRLAKSAGGGMGDLALWNAYRLAWKARDKADAAAKLEKLASDGATRDFRDLATLHLAQLKADELTADQFQKLLSPLLTKRAPFYFTGLLMAAEKYLAESKPNEARPLLKKIIGDADAPASISAAAEALLK